MRQLCCHPGLIKGMLDPESVSHEVIEDGGEDIDLISRLEVMNLEKDESGTFDQCCGAGFRSGRIVGSGSGKIISDPDPK
jgi:hypothetical protein